MTVHEIRTTGSADLEAEIQAAVGQVVQFSNGCWLDLREEAGLFWGVTPYGLDWACNADENWLAAVIRWLRFWDEPRNEAGLLC